MSDPKPYDLSKPEEMLRLVHEVSGYLQVSLDGGTDLAGRCYAAEALRSIKRSDPCWARCLATCAAILHRASCSPAAAVIVMGAVEAFIGRELEGALHSAPTTAHRCETCFFFVVNYAPSGSDGLCRRFPQRVKVHPTHWCGEHRPKVEGGGG